MIDVQYNKEDFVHALKRDFIDILNQNQLLLKMKENEGLLNFQQEDFDNNVRVMEALKKVLKLHLTENAYEIWINTISSGYS